MRRLEWIPLLAIALLLAAAGCRTRLYDLLNDAGAGQPGVDLLVPDLSGDLTVLPDLTPPPDLRPPHYCDGIFVFQEDARLAFFDPVQLVFHDIGLLACPVAGGAQPFSMAVDRLGVAWVEYTDGTLYHVDTYTASCTPTQFLPGQLGYDSFGMGFAADGPNSSSETLYLARGDYNQMGVTPRLGSVDTQSLVVSDIGPLPGLAELTGTGAGELWGFFVAAPPHYGRIDKQTGNVNPDILVPSLGDVSQDAFAFGFFGGVFYAFLAPQMGTTTVYRLDPVQRTVTTVLQNTGRAIVGAGVSTCAPQQ